VTAAIAMILFLSLALTGSLVAAGFFGPLLALYAEVWVICGRCGPASYDPSSERQPWRADRRPPAGTGSEGSG